MGGCCGNEAQKDTGLLMVNPPRSGTLDLTEERQAELLDAFRPFEHKVAKI